MIFQLLDEQVHQFSTLRTGCSQFRIHLLTGDLRCSFYVRIAPLHNLYPVLTCRVIQAPHGLLMLPDGFLYLYIATIIGDQFLNIIPFVDMDEDLKDAATRELFEETGLKGVSLHQIGAFGTPGRDPRGRNICVAFAGMLKDPKTAVQGGDDAAEALWIPARRAPQLGFDHNDILRTALKWLKKTTQ